MPSEPVMSSPVSDGIVGIDGIAGIPSIPPDTSDAMEAETSHLVLQVAKVAKQAPSALEFAEMHFCEATPHMFTQLASWVDAAPVIGDIPSDMPPVTPGIPPVKTLGV